MTTTLQPVSRNLSPTPPSPSRARKRSLFDSDITLPAIVESFKKLNPVHMVRNPVMFVTEVGALVTTIELLFARAHHESLAFVLQITVWLWFTVLFANFAEAMAEGRGKAQADALRRSRTRTLANRIRGDGEQRPFPLSQSARANCFWLPPPRSFPPTGKTSKGP